MIKIPTLGIHITTKFLWAAWTPLPLGLTLIGALHDLLPPVCLILETQRGFLCYTGHN